MFRSVRGSILTLMVLTLAGPTAPARGQDLITINITPEFKYIRDGETAEAPVHVAVGQKVRWVNLDEDNTHTATSRSVAGDRKTPIFDTSFLEYKQFSEKTFDLATFRAAGGQPDRPVVLEYFCRVHPMMMGSRLILSMRPEDITVPPSPPPSRPAPATPAPPARPDPPIGGTGRTVTIEATEANRFDPDPSPIVRPGDIIEWRVHGGHHAIGFTDWSRDRNLITVLGGLEFDADKGQSKGGSDTPGDLLLRIQMKSVPEGRRSLAYFCPHHRTTMRGSLSFEALSPTVPPRPYRQPPYTPPRYAGIAVFEDDKISDELPDSCFAVSADINGDGKPDLITVGPGFPGQVSGEVGWFENPTWDRHVIALLEAPAALAVADIDDDGWLDLAVAYEHGGCLFHRRSVEGAIGWLRNPGRADETTWTLYPVGPMPAAHRIAFGHFLAPNGLELVGVPVVGDAPGPRDGAIKSRVFTRPDDVLKAGNWPSTTIDGRLEEVHDVIVGAFPRPDGNGRRLDSILIASEGGVSWMFPDKDRRWQSMNLGAGERGQVDARNPRSPGCNTVGVHKRGDDPFAYLAAVEPFHGNILAVYTKHVDGSLDRLRWKRHVVDVYGQPDPRSGQGPGHHVIAYDVDNDGDEEFLVALRGPSPYEGVFLYKPVDLEAGKFVRQRVSSFSAARIVIDDYDGDGVRDFATTPFRVRNAFETKDPRVMVFYNRTPQKRGPRPGVMNP